ncbi:UNVERIFIED_CONTAM: hypothetical protein GTU68_033108 [Idotea baltica]|nr:hypothetical protein [Idotea baltica]
MQYENFLYECEATAVLVANDFVPKKEVKSILIKVEKPYEAFAALLRKHEELTKQKVTGIHKTAIIADDAKVGENVYLGAYVVIESGVEIGDDCTIKAHSYIGENCIVGEETFLNSGVKVYYESIIGDNCVIHSGTIIGSDGFGFAPSSDGTFLKIPQTGNVVIENNVEIGANCTIDRATLGSTLIKAGAKLDNLIQVAHNVEIGKNTVIAAQTGISGSTKIGDNCMIGGQVGFAGHLVIAKGSKINAQSGISKSIKEPNKSWSGTPAREFRQHYKGLAYLAKVPALIKSVKEIENKLKG